MVYQVLAIIQLFVRVDVLYITIPYLDWSVFFLVVNITNACTNDGWHISSEVHTVSIWINVCTHIYTAMGLGKVNTTIFSVLPGILKACLPDSPSEDISFDVGAGGVQKGFDVLTSSTKTTPSGSHQ